MTLRFKAGVDLACAIAFVRVEDASLNFMADDRGIPLGKVLGVEVVADLKSITAGG